MHTRAQVSAEVVKEERKLVHTLDNFYPEKSNRADRSFWQPRYKDLIGALETTVLRDATTGPSAVPRYAAELVRCKYDTRKMGIISRGVCEVSSHRP